MKRVALLLLWTLLAGLTLIGPAAPAAAVSSGPGRIVVVHDEWNLSDTGFGYQPVSAKVFALNVANWFTGGSAGKFLVYTHNFGLAGSKFLNTLKAAGHSVTVSTTLPFTLATLQQYDGVFLAGYAVNNQVLIDYVSAGGNVYLAGGTGSLNEASVWNSFLGAFGMAYASGYNGISGNLGGFVSHPLTAGVSQLYYNNGSTIKKLNAGDPDVQILQSSGGKGLLAIYQQDCDHLTPALGWNDPLSDTATYDLTNGAVLPIRFSWGSCSGFSHDESVVVLVSDEAHPDYPVTAYVYGGGVTIADSAGEYRVDFASGDYGLAVGTDLRIDVFIGDQLVGTATVHVVAGAPSP